MFTGLVEETGKITAIEHGSDSVTLAVSAGVCLGDTQVGDSIAVNGCCLTATKVLRRGKAKGFEFNLLRESWDVTNLSTLKRGSVVNLERALAFGQRMGGISSRGMSMPWGKFVSGKNWVRTGCWMWTRRQG